MKRLSITLTKEANETYESWKSHERSKNVSQAIIGYEKRMYEDIRLEDIERRLKEAEEKLLVLLP